MKTLFTLLTLILVPNTVFATAYRCNARLLQIYIQRGQDGTAKFAVYHDKMFGIGKRIAVANAAVYAPGNIMAISFDNPDAGKNEIKHFDLAGLFTDGRNYTMMITGEGSATQACPKVSAKLEAQLF